MDSSPKKWEKIKDFAVSVYLSNFFFFFVIKDYLQQFTSNGLIFWIIEFMKESEYPHSNIMTYLIQQNAAHFLIVSV